MRIRQRDLDSSLIGTLKLDNDVLERILISRGIRKTDDLNKNLSRLPDPRSLKDSFDMTTFNLGAVRVNLYSIFD